MDGGGGRFKEGLDKQKDKGQTIESKWWQSKQKCPAGAAATADVVVAAALSGNCCCHLLFVASNTFTMSSWYTQIQTHTHTLIYLHIHKNNSTWLKLELKQYHISQIHTHTHKDIGGYRTHTVSDRQDTDTSNTWKDNVSNIHWNKI